MNQSRLRLKLAHSRDNRHRGRGYPRAPATPPDMRVRIRRFGGLSRSAGPRDLELETLRDEPCASGSKPVTVIGKRSIPALLQYLEHRLLDKAIQHRLRD
jgi:hypothetical protein